MLLYSLNHGMSVTIRIERTQQEDCKYANCWVSCLNPTYRAIRYKVQGTSYTVHGLLRSWKPQASGDFFMQLTPLRLELYLRIAGFRTNRLPGALMVDILQAMSTQAHKSAGEDYI